MKGDMQDFLQIILMNNCCYVMRYEGFFDDKINRIF
jgi:hypothetical protein